MAELLRFLMQRSDPAFPWGFTVKSNEVSQVTSGTLAALHLAPGDKILEINKMKTRKMSQNEIEAYINGSCKTLDLLIIKGTDSHETADLKESRSGASPILQDRRESQDSWDSGLARSTLNRRDKETSKRNKETSKQIKGNSMQTEIKKVYKSTPETLQEYGNEPYSIPVTRRESRYDQWIQNPDKISGKPVSEGVKQLKAGVEPLSKKKYFVVESEDFNDHEDKEFANRKSESLHYRLLNDNNASYKDKPTGGTFDNQRDKSIHWESPKRRYTESTGCKLGNRRSLNIDELKKNGFGANMESPHFFTRSDYQPKSNRWFTGSNDDSVLNLPCSMESRLNDRSRRAWLDNILSENIANPSSSKSELRKSITTVNESYSTHDGVNVYETHEELNFTKETEQHVKIVDGNKEEVTKKITKNEEYMLTNKDTTNGYPNETKKTIKDYSIAESVLRNGEKEFSNKITNRSEETQDSFTSSRFQERIKGVDPTPSPLQSKYCNISGVQDNDADNINISDPLGNLHDSTDESSIYFSPIKSNGFTERTSGYYKQPSNTDVWGPLLSERVRTPSSSYKQHLDERQGDITFWEVSPDRKSNKTRSSSPSKKNKRNNSDFSRGYSSLTSECSSLTNSDLKRTEPCSDIHKTILRRPKDFLSEEFKEFKGNFQRGKIQIPLVFERFQTMKKIIPEGAKNCSSKPFDNTDSSKETTESNIHMPAQTGNHRKDLNTLETFDITEKASDDNGESSKIKKFIYDFEIADRMSKEENKKKYFRERSKDTAHSSCPTNLKDDLQDCAFKCPLNNEFTFPSNLNQNGLENININSPLLSVDKRHVFVGQHNIKHSSDLEDDVFLTSPSLSPVTNEVSVLHKNNPRTNNSSTENQKHSHFEETKPAGNLEDQPNFRESSRTPPVREGDLKESEIGLNTQYVDCKSPGMSKEDPFKIWMSNLRNQDNQNHLLHLMTPKPFSGHNEKTTKTIPSSKTDEE